MCVQHKCVLSCCGVGGPSPYCTPITVGVYSMDKGFTRVDIVGSLDFRKWWDVLRRNRYAWENVMGPQEMIGVPSASQAQ